MIIRGVYRKVDEVYRPYLRGLIKGVRGDYIPFSFLVDTGPDRTFLPYHSIVDLDLSLEGITIKNDVGGVGARAVPYFEFDTELILIDNGRAKVFAGEIGIFLDPHSSDVPLLGRDVLDHFTLVFDRENRGVILFDEKHRYSIT